MYVRGRMHAYLYACAYADLEVLDGDGDGDLYSDGHGNRYV